MNAGSRPHTTTIILMAHNKVAMVEKSAVRKNPKVDLLINPARRWVVGNTFNRTTWSARTG
jgi:hypothetical protein